MRVLSTCRGVGARKFEVEGCKFYRINVLQHFADYLGDYRLVGQVITRSGNVFQRLGETSCWAGEALCLHSRKMSRLVLGTKVHSLGALFIL